VWQATIVSAEDAERVAAAGVSFAYLCNDAGVVLIVPIN
jgi:hypothetical protein